MYIKDNRLNLQYYNNDKFKLSSENDNFHTKLQPFSNFNGEIKMISKRWSVNRTDRSPFSHQYCNYLMHVYVNLWAMNKTCYSLFKVAISIPLAVSKQDSFIFW